MSGPNYVKLSRGCFCYMWLLPARECTLSRSPALDETELYYDFSPPASDGPCKTIRERWVVRIRAGHAILVGTRNTERPSSLSTRWLIFS
jgi:hypothetical protein